VLAYIEDGRTHGKIIAGGETLDRKGYFVPPTIVRDIPDDAKLVREEQFGPVLPVLRYEDLDEVIARANDSDYGLGGSVWGSDSEKALETALKIDSGTVWVNKFLELPNEIPFAGAKQSGIGVENGLDGLLEFTQAKIVNMAV